jgi:hypothetical protein
MKIKGAGWFALAAAGAEMASLGRRMETQQKLARTVTPPKNEEVREPSEHWYTVNEKAIESLGDTIASLLESLVLNGVRVPGEVMYESRTNLEFMQWLLNQNGISNYVFGSHNLVKD